MKRVVSTSQVLHLWAAQTQLDARNAKGSVFFCGRTCYSYGEHFPMATLHCDKRGEPYQHNGHAEHAGQFRIDRIDVDGTLHAGCHTIKFDELERMARTLGLVSHA